MTDKEFSGIITNVKAMDPWVKIQIDAAPGKIFAWRMVSFISKPRPEVGNRIVCTACPGRLNDYDVTNIISITDAPASQAVSTEITPDPTTLPLPSSMTTIEQLAEKIITLKAQWKDRFASDMLEFKWTVGREISAARGQQDPQTFRELEEKTGINNAELVRCVQFYKKFPNKGYELKAWRDLRAELPAGKEPAPESKAALVVDQKHPWVCPECDAKFEGVHTPDGKHRLRECKAE
jgi:hypothetical protein